MHISLSLSLSKYIYIYIYIDTYIYIYIYIYIHMYAHAKAILRLTKRPRLLPGALRPLPLLGAGTLRGSDLMSKLFQNIL